MKAFSASDKKLIPIMYHTFPDPTNIPKRHYINSAMKALLANSIENTRPILISNIEKEHIGSLDYGSCFDIYNVSDPRLCRDMYAIDQVPHDGLNDANFELHCFNRFLFISNLTEALNEDANTFFVHLDADILVTSKLSLIFSRLTTDPAEEQQRPSFYTLSSKSTYFMAFDKASIQYFSRTGLKYYFNYAFTHRPSRISDMQALEFLSKQDSIQINYLNNGADLFFIHSLQSYLFESLISNKTVQDKFEIEQFYQTSNVPSLYYDGHLPHAIETCFRIRDGNLEAKKSDKSWSRLGFIHLQGRSKLLLDQINQFINMKAD